MSSEHPTPAQRHELDALLRELRPVAIAFSGGVDSSLLYAQARRVLGEDAIGVIGVSPSLARRELDEARRVAALLDAPLLELSTDELARPEYQANSGDRCFHCKTELYEIMRRADSLEGWTLCDGTHAEDAASDRPGMKATTQQGVRSPLREVGLGKAEIRSWARELDLPNWDRPARPCLASRVLVGTPVSAERLGHVDQLEEMLEDAGFRIYRVRIQEQTLIVTVDASELDRLGVAPWRAQVTERGLALGYKRVLLDLNGYGAPTATALSGTPNTKRSETP